MDPACFQKAQATTTTTQKAFQPDWKKSMHTRTWIPVTGV